MLQRARGIGAETATRLLDSIDLYDAHLDLIAYDSGIYFVDDGSKDKTRSIIEELAEQNTRIHGIKLSRTEAIRTPRLRGAASVRRAMPWYQSTADLQDDISRDRGHGAQARRQGAEIVFGSLARHASSDTWHSSVVRRSFSYYRLLSRIGVEIVSQSRRFQASLDVAPSIA
ncbi:MAG: glycosyltransferase [Chromatiales bacterium]|nr:glycosyltransferase [Chromatiales bacterium]